MSRFNPLLKILYEIEIECADAIEKQRTEETEKNLDNFTKMKRRLAAEMRDLRKAIDERNQLLGKKKGDRAQVAKDSAAIRKRIKKLEDEAKDLQALQEKRGRKLAKTADKDEKDKAQLEKEQLVVKLTYDHIKDLKKSEAYGTTSRDDDDNLFTEGIDQEEIDRGQGWVSGIPDIDDPQFVQLRLNDDEIEAGLEEVLQGVRVLKGIAVDINGELKRQDPEIEQLNVRVDKTRATLETLNTQLSKTLKKVRSPMLLRLHSCYVLAGCCCCYVLHHQHNLTLIFSRRNVI